ncbi:protein of unknown function [Taphrina deformans PYCC 5710]|uniref:Short-chain dehydrogenase/reductase 2 n=1 Tax=Taphrina deformans (strain PYCC 5710 / ATCC 11124 / CBS 356.35 / IMI 108563 / JCM 9778 / NBRC 8474) TaxID=1097556 RepID=R4XLS8_TAPDE|nr:protein of unknown function [Taphrina deformans PYCC 5710]|eukprot:CCG84250.1 protein of unknown function [Taphrina deformans PYCC 5710]
MSRELSTILKTSSVHVRRLLQTHRKKVIGATVLYLLFKVNALLSRRALNHGTTDKYDWSKEIVLVTGGSSGIGYCVVNQLSNRGIKVIILDLHPPPETNPYVHFFRCDITSRDNLADVGRQIIDAVGHPTVLINNAGIVTPPNSILDKPWSDITRTLLINASSHFLTTQQFVRTMVSSDHGHVVTVASVAAFLAGPNVSDYNMSKAAALSFHESLGTELKHVHRARNVRTSVVCPGYVKTPLHRSQAFGSVRNPLLRDAIGPETVAAEIVKVVLGAQSKTVVVPKLLGAVTGSRGWSEWLFRSLLDRCATASLS